MPLRQLLFVGNRRFHLGRVVGLNALFQTVIWSVIVVGVITAYEHPSITSGPLTVGQVLHALPYVWIPIVVPLVAVFFVAVNFVREVRYVLFGRRRGRSSYGGRYYDGTDADGDYDGDGDFFDFGGGDFDVDFDDDE